MMGGIRQDFGRICIESRRESFVIHAEYGYRPARVARRDLMPGDWFRHADGDGPYYVRSIEPVRLFYSVGDGTASMLRDDLWVIPCDAEGEPLDVEDDPDAGAFGETWRSHGGPEFLNEDLDDLIAALVELRENPR